jgi:hypothetical protein
MKVPIPTNWRRRASSATALFALACCLAPAASSAALPDGRGWELVSPVNKNGGSIGAAGEIAAGGVLQAAADGNSITYSSAASFGPGAQGATPGSQYLGSRVGSGWATENLTVSLFSGSYGPDPDGVPYQLFSPDLDRGLLLSGRHCRSVEAVCPVANPPLPGTDAPGGYQNYYLRQAGGFEALLGAGDLAATDIAPAEFDLVFAGAAPDLSHIVLSSCAALTAGASEVVLGEGCDPTKPNLYEWSPGTGLSLVNAAPGAQLAAQGAAVSSDGASIYFTEGADLYLRQGAELKQVDAAAGGGGSFETASANGSVAFFSKGAHLWRYLASADTATDLTPAGGVLGVLGASTDGSYLYYLAADGLYLNHGATTTKVAATADASNYPPSNGSARVSADGTHLLFLSSASLTGYDNSDQKTGLPDTEVFLYSAAGAGQLRCVSCRPRGTRPIGPSTIPGSLPNGKQQGATNSYKPRVLSVDGSRVFFDSLDAVVNGDSNGEPDVYQWEAQGQNCTNAAGCVSLISRGRAAGGASFVDASLNGNDAFFLTDGSLVGEDPGSFDLYDARVGGGFPEPLIPIPCFGDNCQNLPSEQVDPGLGTQVAGPGNPPVHYVKHGRSGTRRCKAGAKAAGKCKQQGKKGKKARGKGAAKRGGRR